MKITAKGPWFSDETGRVLIFHGVNLSGSSKVPFTPNGATHLQEGFFDHRDVSFIGRPFPLDQAHEHFSRLKAWGFKLLRFLVTWEAIEHAGPGQYDEAYLDYLHEVLRLAGEYGFSVIIDPHQDVWSRFSGGDGAPGWTLEAVGFHLDRIQETGAAILHQFHGDPFPQMIWPTNGARLAAATMLTLFFGGNDFAPKTRIDGKPVQEYLQGHYIAAFQRVAERVKDLDCVIGYESFNEPLSGFIGQEHLARPPALKFGPVFSPLQSILLGDGFPQEIEVWERRVFRSHLVDRQLVNPKRLRIWREGYDGVWRQNGVWDLDEKGHPQLLRPHHFAEINGHQVDFSRDYMRPFVNRYAAAIREINPDALIFFETDPRMPPPAWGPEDEQNIVYAPHWYDAIVLFLKTYSPWLGFDTHTFQPVVGPNNIRRSFAQQLRRHKEYAAALMGDIPTLIGEIGIAFDLNRRSAYRTSDFRQHILAMDRSLRAADDNLLSYTIWNYTPDNDNQRGDQWNGEDLSIYSADQAHGQTGLYAGGRALPAVIRPYPVATAGTPLRLSFDMQRCIFTYEFSHDPAVQAPTEIFVPHYHYPNGYDIWTTDGEFEVNMDEQILYYWHSTARQIHRIRITPRA